MKNVLAGKPQKCLMKLITHGNIGRGDCNAKTEGTK